MFRPGELDEKIEFYENVRVDDGMGGVSLTPQAIESDVWAKVRPLTGKETERFDKLNADELTLFVTRFRTDIEEDHLINWGGESFNIRHIPKKSRRSMYSEYYAERGVAQ